MIIGLTGGIASGKTSATSFLESLGIPIIDADIIARTITEPNHPVLAQLADAFGNDIIVQGKLDRKKLREIAFSSPSQIKKLNSITHPAIHKLLVQNLETTPSSTYKVLSAPLLFENNLDVLCDETWLIDVDETTQIQRIIQRDHSDIQSAKKIINAQINPKIKRERADIIIDNSKGITQLEGLILKQHHLTLEKLK